MSFQGHKWSLSAFLKHLKANNIDTVQLMQSIEDVIIKVNIKLMIKIMIIVAKFMPMTVLILITQGDHKCGVSR